MTLIIKKLFLFHLRLFNWLRVMFKTLINNFFPFHTASLWLSQHIKLICFLFQFFLVSLSNIFIISRLIFPTLFRFLLLDTFCGHIILLHLCGLFRVYRNLYVFVFILNTVIENFKTFNVHKSTALTNAWTYMRLQILRYIVWLDVNVIFNKSRNFGQINWVFITLFFFIGFYALSSIIHAFLALVRFLGL